MDKLLTNPMIEPTDPIIKEVLGKFARTYLELAKLFRARNYDLGWRYYRDSKAWLCKVAKGKKTICWLSLWDSGVKLSFFFTEKNFPHDQQFHHAETPSMWGKMLPVILLVQNDKYFDEIVKLSEIKEAK